jgi:hypothetical protein
MSHPRACSRKSAIIARAVAAQLPPNPLDSALIAAQPPSFLCVDVSARACEFVASTARAVGSTANCPVLAE